MHSGKRAQIELEIKNQMVDVLEGRGFVIESILLKSIKLPRGLYSAIESKLEAEQQAQQMEFVLQRETKEAERKRIEAEGIRDAQNIIKEGITEANIEWKSLEVLRELSSSTNAKIIITDGKTPLIMKLLQGTQGNGMVLAETMKAAESVMSAFKQVDADILVQEFIKESSGIDIRVIVVGNKVVAAMQRVAPEGEFRSNVHRGAATKHIDLTSEEKEIAIKSTKVLGLNVAGVDLMRSKRGPLVLEVNSSPGLQGIELLTGADVAGEIISYIESIFKNK